MSLASSYLLLMTDPLELAVPSLTTLGAGTALFLFLLWASLTVTGLLVAAWGLWVDAVTWAAARAGL